jgi:hypothetical protein
MPAHLRFNLFGMVNALGKFRQVDTEAPRMALRRPHKAAAAGIPHKRFVAPHFAFHNVLQLGKHLRGFLQRCAERHRYADLHVVFVF